MNEKICINCKTEFSDRATEFCCSQCASDYNLEKDDSHKMK